MQVDFKRIAAGLVAPKYASRDGLGAPAVTQT